MLTYHDMTELLSDFNDYQFFINISHIELPSIN